MSRALLSCRDAAGLSTLVANTYGGYGTIYAGTVTQDIAGSPKQTFAAVGTAACAISFVRFEREQVAGEQIKSRSVYQMSAPLDTTLYAHYQVRHGGFTFEVRSVSHGETDPTQILAELVQVS